MANFWCIVFIFLKLVVASEDSTLGKSNLNPANSCNEIYQHNPTTRGGVGKYWIKNADGLSEVTCVCQRGWMQIVDVDMNRDNSRGTYVDGISITH